MGEDEDGRLIGLQCTPCRRRVLYDYAAMMRLWTRPGEDLAGLMGRMRCRDCGGPPEGPYWFPDSGAGQDWQCSSVPGPPRVKA